MPAARCEVCGNEYDKAFQVTMRGASHTFDSFECAIQALAPTCAHCNCRVIGHGVEKEAHLLLRLLRSRLRRESAQESGLMNRWP